MKLGGHVFHEASYSNTIQKRIIRKEYFAYSPVNLDPQDILNFQLAIVGFTKKIGMSY